MDFAAARRRRSRRSGQADRVEVAHVAGRTAVRDSENPYGPVPFPGEVDWSAFAK